MQRYSYRAGGLLISSNDGDYVHHDDAQAEIARLKLERNYAQDSLDAAQSEIARLTAALADANTSVIAFSSIWAVQYAKDLGLPEGHLAPVHYDILAKAGARMDGFSRAKDMEAGNG